MSPAEYSWLANNGALGNLEGVPTPKLCKTCYLDKNEDSAPSLASSSQQIHPQVPRVKDRIRRLLRRKRWATFVLSIDRLLKVIDLNQATEEYLQERRNKTLALAEKEVQTEVNAEETVPESDKKKPRKCCKRLRSGVYSFGKIILVARQYSALLHLSYRVLTSKPGLVGILLTTTGQYDKLFYAAQRTSDAVQYLLK